MFCEFTSCHKTVASPKKDDSVDRVIMSAASYSLLQTCIIAQCDA